jgi:hypothetical protein
MLHSAESWRSAMLHSDEIFYVHFLHDSLLCNETPSCDSAQCNCILEQTVLWIIFCLNFNLKILTKLCCFCIRLSAVQLWFSTMQHSAESWLRAMQHGVHDFLISTKIVSHLLIIVSHLLIIVAHLLIIMHEDTSPVKCIPFHCLPTFYIPRMIRPWDVNEVPWEGTFGHNIPDYKSVCVCVSVAEPNYFYVIGAGAARSGVRATSQCNFGSGSSSDGPGSSPAFHYRSWIQIRIWPRKDPKLIAGSGPESVSWGYGFGSETEVEPNKKS